MKKTFLLVCGLLCVSFMFLLAGSLKKQQISSREKRNVSDEIRLETPLIHQEIKSPLVIKGEARGTWFFEASFPVFLVDGDGRTIAQGVAQAKGDWMTENFVPFEAMLTFALEKEHAGRGGVLLLKKDNPSGLPQYDEALEVPIVYASSSASSSAVCTQEAKICPDGSAVGRTGPNCEFAKCPGE
jgi:hypothetical protein